MKKNTKQILFISISIISIILIIIFINGFIAYRKNKESMSANQKIWALSFGGGEQNYQDAVNRISNEMHNNTNSFDEIVIKTDADLKQDTDFWPQHGNFIETNKRGYGYWLWKPYLIMKTFEQMKNNDILFYVDSGCELPDNSNSPKTNEDQINDLIDLCNKNTILYTLSAFDEKLYNKMDLVTSMNANNDHTMNTLQNAATIIVIKKTNQTTKFVKEWYTTCCKYSNIDDTPSIIPNDPEFVDHRHDQSVFSLLTKSDEYNMDMDTPENKINGSPFLLSRKRNG